MVITQVQPPTRELTEVTLSGSAVDAIQVARDDERRRLSAEIHDGVAQWITSARYRLKACRQLAVMSSPEALRSEISDVEKLLQTSARELRRLIADLRPLPLEELGLVGALRQLAVTLEETGIKCLFAADGVPLGLTPAEERAIYGIVQEALTNIRKHSGARNADIHIKFEEVVSITVTEDGQGFDPAEATRRKCRPTGFGLQGIKERAIALGAHLEMESSPGRGSTIRLSFVPDQVLVRGGRRDRRVREGLPRPRHRHHKRPDRVGR